MGPQELADPADLADYLNKVREDFPGLMLGLALKAYAQKHYAYDIYWYEDGTRHVWESGDLIQQNISYPKRTIVRVDDRYYLVWKKTPTLAQINRPKTRQFERTVRHPSEKGWNLPQNHPRHLLNFPKEIQQLIFFYAITVRKPYAVRASTVYSNWKTELRDIMYHRVNVRFRHDYSRCNRYIWSYPVPDPNYVSIGKSRDSRGTYTTLTLVARLEINSTFLRSSKYMYDMCNKMLYGDNDFHFTMLNASYHKSPPLFTATSVVQIHPQCDYDICGKEYCDENLILALTYYIPFIKRFCTGLEKLCIYALADRAYLEDPGYWNIPAGGECHARPGGEGDQDDVIAHIDASDTDNKGDQSGQQAQDREEEEAEDTNMSFVDETVEWIAERAANGKREQCETYAKVKAEENKVLAAQAREEKLLHRKQPKLLIFGWKRLKSSHIEKEDAFQVGMKWN
ncbi:hypothetical protein BDZ45DRAFT_751568 [Acephala macrosclerotiorum]|nr:hypothetical protein BDZ45DRAFT_751568 [Acephala macrosclerotiorum]